MDTVDMDMVDMEMVDMDIVDIFSNPFFLCFLGILGRAPLP